jgi:hypothetical protein
LYDEQSPLKQSLLSVQANPLQIYPTPVVDILLVQEHNEHILIPLFILHHIEWQSPDDWQPTPLQLEYYAIY